MTTRPSRHRPWKQVGTLTGELPAAWLTGAVFASDLLPFHTDPATRCIIPRDATGGLHPTPPSEPFWDELDLEWDDRRGRGRSTPRTLADQIDYQHKLSAQLDKAGGWAVIHNKSGQHLRAARIRTPIVVNNDCYRLDVADADEAAYLVALLNADSLQDTYRASRRSDRDFHTHIWRGVPLRRYDPDDETHQLLAYLCELAEEVAGKLVADGLTGGQVKRSTAIQAALRETRSVANDIAHFATEAVRQ